MDMLTEKMRRWRRNLDGGPLSFKKIVFLVCFVLGLVLYVGPSFLSWLFGGSNYNYDTRSQSCVDDKFILYADDLARFNAHTLHSPWRPYSDRNFLPYVGNGHIGLPTDDSPNDSGKLYIFGGLRHLNVAVPFKPLVHLNTNSFSSAFEEKGTVVHYTNGVVHNIKCNPTTNGNWVSVNSLVYAHRSMPSILVQELRIANPSADKVIFSVDRLGILGEWTSADSRVKTIEHGDGNQKYIIVSGLVQLPHDQNLFKMVVIVMKRLDSTIEVQPKMTETLNVLTSVAYSENPFPKNKNFNEKSTKEFLEKKAIDALLKAVSMTVVSLRQNHYDVWQKLWTSGFGISHSYAENAVNELDINATMYYVMSHSPAPLHVSNTSVKEKEKLSSQLAYLEGCYGGNPTIHAKMLWRSLVSVQNVNDVVRAWKVTLEKNGCQKLVKAGADGVVQAMVLSFLSLKFREDHLELNSHPKDLHRDYHLRRVSYGNETHLNISIVVHENNKAVIYVGVDKRNKDYFACDAGCLDPPIKLNTIPQSFPVKLTDPVTAILYITWDHQHMNELKEAIHYKEMGEAPAHEHHVIALHKHGNKLGGLPTIFWFSIGFLIFVFHVFLFKLIWQEYCSGQDKFRSRKFSDYQ